nr:hypothetical protein [Tanacetum cinerariifolium]
MSLCVYPTTLMAVTIEDRVATQITKTEQQALARLLEDLKMSLLSQTTFHLTELMIITFYCNKGPLYDTMSSHLQHLTKVLLVMSANSLFAKQTKCVFAMDQVESLGHVISTKGVDADPSKNIAMKEWHALNNVEELRGFLNDVAQEAFLQLKESMIQVPVLALPHFVKEFIVKTDASRTRLGAVLQEGGPHCLHKLITPFQTKWLPKLMGFDYEISYKKGADNRADDALSRLTTSAKFNAMVLSTIESKLLGKSSWLLKYVSNSKYVKCYKHYNFGDDPYLLVWGCRAVVRLPDPKLKTLGERGTECIFVGYAKHSKAFRFYVIEPNDSVLINSIIESRDAIFNENRFSLVRIPSLKIPNETEYISGSVVLKEVTKKVAQQPESELRKSKRNRTPNNFRPEFQLYLIEETKDEKEAINDEMDSIMGNNTWVLADLPLCCRPLVCKRIFKRKLKYHKTADCDDINSQSDYSSNGCEDSFPECKFDESSKGVIVYLYFDDMLIFGTDQVQVDLTKEFLSSRFSIKDIGKADVILVSTLMDISKKLLLNNGQAVSQLEYSRIIGYLMYAMTCIRPNIAFAMGKLSRYTSNPDTQRCNTEDNSSTSGWVFLLGGETAGKEAEWLTNLLLEILLWVKRIAPISIRYDSATTLARDYSQMYNGKSRHLGVKYSMIHKLITNKVDHQDVMEKLAQQQDAAFQALFDTLRAKLQATRGLLQNRQGAGVINVRYYRDLCGWMFLNFRETIQIDGSFPLMNTSHCLILPLINVFILCILTAVEWFHWMSMNGLITTWAKFEESVKNHFGPLKYEDLRGALSKLLQLGTVEEYQREFKKLMNKVTDISDSLLISVYISGLKLNLQHKLLVLIPTMLGDAFSLARIIEARFEAIAKKEKKHIVKKKTDVILPLQSELGSPKIKGSLNTDEDINDDESSSAVDGVFDMGGGEVLGVGEDNDSGNANIDGGDDAVESEEARKCKKEDGKRRCGNTLQM